MVDPELPELTAVLADGEVAGPSEPDESPDRHEAGGGPVAEARAAAAMLATATALTVAAEGDADGARSEGDSGDPADGDGLELTASHSVVVPDEHVLTLTGEQVPSDLNAAPPGDLATDSVFDDRLDRPSR